MSAARGADASTEAAASRPREMKALRNWMRSSSSGVSSSIRTLLDDISSASGSAAIANTIVNLLEPLEFEIHTITSRAGAEDLRYVLVVHHRRAKAVWKHRRSFDEYDILQRDVTRALHHGHFCSGGCPWLESFLGAAFPQTSSLLRSSLSSTVIERRRKTLLEVVQTIQQFLINRLNHSCSHVLQHVAHVFLEFVYGDVIDSAHVLDRFINAATEVSPTNVAGGLQFDSSTTKARRRRTKSTSALGSAMSTLTANGSLEVPVSPVLRRSFVGVAEEPELCAICEQAMPVKDIYVVRLRCGHRFHDECAMPKLNEQLKCPTCDVSLAEVA